MTEWADARAASILFAVDPSGTGGVSLRSPAGPARDEWLAALRQGLAGTALRRMPPTIPDDRLLGGLDLAATLSAGRPVHARGLLAEADGDVLLIPMAERLPRATAARLAATADGGAGFGIAALDEGATPEERPPAALLDRLAFHLVLPDTRPDAAMDAIDIAAARRRLPGVWAGDAIVDALCTTAMALGIESLRAPFLALRVAHAAAAVAGRSEVSAEDAALAARLVLSPRAVSVPQAEPAQEPEADPSEEDDRPADAEPEAQDSTEASSRSMDDIVLQAAQAAIPAGLLAQLRVPPAQRSRVRTAGVAGALQRSTQRGRPAGVRPGDPRSGLRLNVIETLRAAAPWQRLRQRAPGATRLEVRRQDYRVNILKQRSETTTIFVVDASGSAAFNRLAEAKGAVELLLAECYVRRDRVAVIAFRGAGAQLLLPPTRSLVRAKRSLAGLPGGGGTPLAAGIDAGAALADEVRRRGGTPTLVLLTDGRPNVARDGKGNRARAEQEAGAAARQLGVMGVAVLLVDTSPRPHPPNQRLAAEMGARYVALPYADAVALSRAVQAAAR